MLRLIVMSTNLEYRKRERQRKRESRRQASEAQRAKKSDRGLDREVKNDGAEFRSNNNMKILYLPVAASKVKMSG